MNSFAFLERGVQAEIERQTGLLEAGEPVVQETLHFDPATGRSDAAALQGGGARLPLLPGARPGAAGGHRGDGRRARGDALPELPAERAARFERELGLSADRARELAFRAELGDYFERALARARRRRRRRPWPTGSRSWSSGSAPTPIRRRARCVPRASPRWWRWSKHERSAVTPPGRCSRSWSQKGETRGRSSSARASARSATTGGLTAAVDQAIAADPAAADQVRAGNMKAIGPLVGYVMRETKGAPTGARSGG